MKRFARILLIITAVLVVLLFAGVWLLNRWLKSPELHAQVEKQLSLALKMPLKFQSVTISVLGGLKAEGVTVPDRGRNFFEATSFSAQNDLFSLIQGTIAFKEIRVEAPKFMLVQRASGDWKLPDLPPEWQAELDAKKKAKTTAKAGEPKVAEAATKTKKTGEIRVGRIRIINGSADVFDKDGRPFVSAMGIGTTLSDVRDDTVEGHVAISRLVWHDNYAATDVHATVSQTAKGLIIQDFKATMGGGLLTGGFSNKPEPGPPFNAKIALENVDVARAAADADASPPNLDGILTGTLDLKGIGDNKKTFTGKTAFTLRNATCREIDWVNQLGEVMKQEDVDLTAFHIQDMKGEATIGSDRIFIETLTASAPPLAMSAKGVSRLDGTKLDVKANLLADRTFLTKRPNIEPQFGPASGDQMRSVQFTLTGSLGKPKQNLMEKLTGTADKTEQKIKLGMDLINGIKAEQDEEKKAAPAGRGKP